MTFTMWSGTVIIITMRVRYVYWQESDQWLGYLEEFPDYWSQGETVDDLKEHLRDLFEDLSQDLIPEVLARRILKKLEA